MAGDRDIEDGRPRWMLREQARISNARRTKYGELPADPEIWWAQIEAIAAELKIKTERADWQVWPT
jgi:hypothetical protein